MLSTALSAAQEGSEMRRWLLSAWLLPVVWAQELPLVSNVEHQPLGAQVQRVVEALDMLGEPLPATEKQELARLAGATSDTKKAVAEMQKILDRHCLVGVNINPESRVK